MTNRSKVPWTTGSALTLKGLLPLGQDILGYTPVGARSLVPLTQAVDVRAGFKEEETKREPKALRVGRVDYTRVTKHATFTIQNFRSQKTLMRIRLSLGGRVTAASGRLAPPLGRRACEQPLGRRVARRGRGRADADRRLRLRLLRALTRLSG